ncbi:MAG: serine/threonine-protein kinase [Acidobacteria bacterium]|nr:serine/threonine-protein kinase [Acidobacteriota bacterium]
MSKQIGSFEIVRRLEAHAGAASYVGRDSTDGSPATIDVWAAEMPDAQARFLDRATAAAVLEHDHVARILDFGIDKTTSCRIEEACDGETLETRLRQGDELPRETALAWLAQIARALEYAHGMGVIHGDLHPGMVTIRSDGTAALRGFANPRTTGKLRYRAPELLRGDPADARTDLYAFGVLLHRLLTYEPGRHQTVPRRLKSAASLPLKDLPSDFPRRLLPVLEGCLDEDPAGRLDSFTSVLGALEATAHDVTATEASLADVELRGRVPGKDGDPPPSLEKVAAAIKRPSRSRFRRRWLTFATVAGTALWVGGTLWWSKGSPAVAGSDAPVAEEAVVAEAERPGTADAAPNPLPSGDVPLPTDGTAPAGTAANRPLPVRPASLGTGRLALAPAWHPEITVSVAGGEPVVLDRRRVFEVEAGVDHVLTFELATRDYQIREQLVTQVPSGRLLETPVPLVRPGFLSVAPADESARPVFVRIGDEAIGWTPINGLQIPVGTHVLSVFKNPTWRPEERVDQQIRVRSRQETTVHFDLESEPPALIVDGQRIEYAPVDEEPAP